MLSAVFFEKAVWAFFALVASLIAVIYKLFNGSLQKDLKIQQEIIKNDLELKFENKFNKRIENIELEIIKLREELSSFKRHENNNASFQNKLLKKVLLKLDNHDPEILNNIINEE